MHLIYPNIVGMVSIKLMKFILLQIPYNFFLLTLRYWLLYCHCYCNCILGDSG